MKLTIFAQHFTAANCLCFSIVFLVLWFYFTTAFDYIYKLAQKMIRWVFGVKLTDRDYKVQNWGRG